MRIYEHELEELSLLAQYMQRYKIHPTNALDLTLPPSIGEGVLRHQPFGTEMALSTGRFRFNEPVEMIHSLISDVMAFCVMRTGTMWEEVDRRQYLFEPGYIYWVRFESVAGLGVVPDAGYNDIIQLRFDPSLIAGWEGEEQVQNVPDEPVKIYRKIPIDPEIDHLINDLHHNPHTGPLEKLYAHSKTNELMVALLERFSPRSAVSPEDRAALNQARSLLLSNLKEHPTIPQIARQSGLNEQKLKQGFKTLWGKSIYQTLLDVRMERAKVLLKRGDVSVKEAAWEVGYTHISTFIAAFEKRYGERPGVFKKRYR